MILIAKAGIVQPNGNSLTILDSVLQRRKAIEKEGPAPTIRLDRKDGHHADSPKEVAATTRIGKLHKLADIGRFVATAHIDLLLSATETLRHDFPRSLDTLDETESSANQN